MIHFSPRSFVLRYSLLLSVLLLSLEPLTFVLRPLTVYGVQGVLGVRGYESTLLAGNTLFIEGQYISLITACIAPSAFFILLLLCLTLPGKRKDYLRWVGMSWGLLFLVNITRIIILASVALEGYDLFETAHAFFWYIGNALFILAIWASVVLTYKIRAIPIYTEWHHLYRIARGKR